ncbi:BQ5605_C037g11604 [Microbotryum silenes-dioicae]|uniref:BQ5605_C037g11604 protein n=1 Tax=Microbotryum silenes-dioicae TaxID=796604 RepID=A0A2X0PA81_9BASI|nr:BQ5605_C037g11604 [Microbotryum silenes-dioicae]
MASVSSSDVAAVAGVPVPDPDPATTTTAQSTTTSSNNATPVSADDQVLVATLGLFILDTFEWRSNTHPAQILRRSDLVIGGGGTYAILGARMWLPPRQLGIIVDRGNDWDCLGEVEKSLAKFGEEMWVWRDQKDVETCKALNLYRGEHRDFKYLTPRIRLDPSVLPPRLRSAHSLHFVCSPSRALEIISQLEPTPTYPVRPLTFYEPIPDRCIPEELDVLKQVLGEIDVFSPNHEEASSFFGISTNEVIDRGLKGIEELAHRFLELGSKSYVVIRSGAWGAYAIQRDHPEQAFWMGPYHGYEKVVGVERGKVKDVTGAGNSFMGGLMSGLAQGKSLRESVRMGIISASFTIEQFGLPSMTLDEGGNELWNGALPADRLKEMRLRSPA